MTKRALAVTVTLFLMFLATTARPALAQDATAASQADSARAVIERVGTGPKARVRVTLRDRTELKGYVSSVAADAFSVTDAKTGDARSVAFSDVARVKRSGGMSGRGWAILGGSAAAAIIVIVVVLAPVLTDGGAA